MIIKFYASLTQEEQVHSTPQPRDSSSVVSSFSVKTPTTCQYVQQSNKDAIENHHCTHCERSRHEVDQCFLLHGFPDWYKECQNMGEKGTTHGKRRGRGRITHENHVLHSSSTPTKEFDDACVSFTDEQCGMLCSFLASKPTINMTGNLWYYHMD